MQNLTRDEQLTIARYLTEPHGWVDTWFRYVIYFVPSLLFGLYGMLKGDFAAVAVGYIVLFGLVVYLISYQRKSGPLFRSALRKLMEGCRATTDAAAKPASGPSE